MDHQFLIQIDQYENATEQEKSAVQSAIFYIHENIQETITLDDLARAADLNRYYFSHVFKRITQISPIQYVQLARLEEAKTLLITTDLPIDEISARVGYQSGSTLSSLFVKKLGVTPGKYRRQLREKSKIADCFSQSDDIQ